MPDVYLSSERAQTRYYYNKPRSELSRSDDLWGDLVLRGSVLLARGFERLDHVHGLSIRNLAEDDVLVVEPASDNGGDEELRSIAVMGTSISG